MVPKYIEIMTFCCCVKLFWPRVASANCRYFALEVMVEDLTDFNESSSVIVSVYWTLYNIDIDNDLKGGDRGG